METIDIKNGLGALIKIPAKLIKGVLTPIQLSEYVDGPQLDAFSRLRVSNPNII